MFDNVCFVLDEFIAHGLFGIRGHRPKLRYPVDHVDDEMETVKIVEHGHIERGCGRPFFLVPTDMQIVMVGPPIGETMDQPRIAVIGEDDGLVGREQRIKVTVREPMRMFFLWL